MTRYGILYRGVSGDARDYAPDWTPLQDTCSYRNNKVWLTKHRSYLEIQIAELTASCTPQYEFRLIKIIDITQ